MRLLRNTSILLVVFCLAVGAGSARVRAQGAVDENGNGCIDLGPDPAPETSEWRVPPRLISGPPDELADRDGPPIEVGPSVWEFTLSEGEFYLGGCGEDGEIISMLDGQLTLTIPQPSDDPGIESFVTFMEDTQSDRCTTPTDSDPRTCRIFPGETVELIAGDVAYHPRGARYQYTPSGNAQLVMPSSGTSPIDGVAAGGVRAAGAPLAQQGGSFQSTSKRSKPLSCDGDCRP